MKPTPLSLRLSSASVLLSLALAVPSATLAQTAKPAAKPAAKPHTAAAAATTHSAAACSKLPSISPKIPALPAGLPCAHPLYTITTIPAAKLENVSPMESPGLREYFGLESISFSLDYIDVKVGTGPVAAPHKWYSVHYTGYLVDGTKFDSSFDHPDKAPLAIEYGQRKVIPGWDTGLDGMRVGGKRRLFIPFQLAYGAKANGPIPPQSELIFDVELVAQSDTDPTPPPPPPPAAPAAPSTPPATPGGAPSQPATPPAPTGTGAPPTPPNP